MSKEKVNDNLPDHTTVLDAPCRNLLITIAQYGVANMNRIKESSKTITATIRGIRRKGYL